MAGSRVPLNTLSMICWRSMAIEMALRSSGLSNFFVDREADSLDDSSRLLQ